MCRALEQLEQKGIRQGMKQVAINMLNDNMDKSDIARLTQLSMNEITVLEASLKED